MTEKRFTVQRIYKGMDGGVKYYDWCVMKDDEIVLRLTTRMDCKDVVEVLNELSEENEKLKQNCKNYEWYKQYKAVLNENEQLKQELVQLEEENQGQSDAIDGLQEMMAHYNLEDLND